MVDAVDAARRGAWADCLSALLVVWRRDRDPKLAALIDRVSAVAARDVAPVAGAGSATAAVEARIANATDADVAVILDHARRQIRVYPRAQYWIIALATDRAPDPRIATALAELVERPAFVAYRGHGALVPEVVEALDAIDDPRYRRLLVDEWRRLEPKRGRIRKHRRGLDKLAHIARSIEHRPAPAPATDHAALIADIDAALARPAPRAATRDAAELLAAIYANPADTALRLVYADALQDRGDPRGEFIALQCNRGDGEPSRRERQLLKAYARLWLGAIEPIVYKQGVVYRRGFVACVREGLKQTANYPRLEAIEWSTVEELDVSLWGERAVDFLLRWPALRRVYQVYGADVPALVDAGAPRPWTALGVRYAPDDIWPLLESLCPALEELDLAAISDPHAAIRQLGALGRRLRRVRVGTRWQQPAELVAAARAAGIAELELVADYSFPGDPEGDAVRIAGDAVVLVHHDASIKPRYAAAILDALPERSIRHATLTAPPRSRVDDASWAALARALRRHGVELARPG
ncbi:MAG TPA: TIGR02996 domain-containing protein [Kofleriaceae bacterium]|nr:TIGR02996 domain-containing protein [Kofleriaceae bacterium]